MPNFATVSNFFTTASSVGGRLKRKKKSLFNSISIASLDRKVGWDIFGFQFTVNH